MIGMLLNYILYFLIVFCILAILANILWALIDLALKDFKDIKYKIKNIFISSFLILIIFGTININFNYKLEKSFEANKIEFELVGDKNGNAKQYYVIYNTQNDPLVTASSDRIEIHKGNYDSIKVEFLTANNFIGYMGFRKYIFYVPINYSF